MVSMMKVFAAVAAIAAVHVTSVGASNCGWLKEKCCGNECIEDRTACWEGTCMPCGGDGKPVCPYGKECDKCMKEKDDFCVWDNNAGCTHTQPPPPFRDNSDHCGWINEECCAHGGPLCLAARSECWEGTCMPCGGDGKPVCTSGKVCDTGNKEKDGFCVHDNSVDVDSKDDDTKDGTAGKKGRRGN